MAEFNNLSDQQQIGVFGDIVRGDIFHLTPTVSRDPPLITEHGFTITTNNPLLHCDNDRTRRNYLCMLSGWILYHAPVVLVHVTDMNFTNAIKFIRALEKETEFDALDDFTVNNAGQRTNRIIEFHHTITTKLSAKHISSINKWSKVVAKLPRVIFTEHSIVEFDLNEGNDFHSFLAAGNREIVRNNESDRVMGEIHAKYGLVMFASGAST